MTVERARRRGLGALAARRSRSTARCATSARSPSTPPSPIVGFAIFSRVVVGAWFVGERLLRAREQGARRSDDGAGGDRLGRAHAERRRCWPWIGGAGVALRVVVGLVSRERADALVVLALLGDGRDPVDRVSRRPSVPHPLHGAADRGRGDRRRRRRGRRAAARALRAACAVALLALAGYELRPLDASAPMVVEAQWDRPNAAGARAGHRVPRAAARRRRRSWRAWDRSATTCRRRRVAASRSAISCTKATATSGSPRSSEPRPFAGWMLIEEKAEGGDMLARRAREQPAFLDGIRARLRRRGARALSSGQAAG